MLFKSFKIWRKKHHREALAPFGLDASDPEFWNIGLNTISSLIDELEAA